VFVLSLPRSGSTLLRLILDTHPQIACPGELRLGRSIENLYHSIYYTTGQLIEGDEDERVKTVYEQVRHSVNAFMTAYAHARGKRMWAEKTPENISYAARLKATFPNARFVCLHRHPLDLIRSGFEAAKFGKLVFDLWDHDSGCDFYVKQTRMLLDFQQANPDVCFPIKYEDIVNDAERGLEPMFAFLGLRWDSSLIAKVFNTPHDDGLGDPKARTASHIYTSSIGRGAELAPILAQIAPRLRDEIAAITAELGYPPLQAQAEPMSTNPEGSPNSIDEFFRMYVPAKLSRMAKLKGSVQFQVKGAGGGAWNVNLNSTPAEVRSGTADTDCTITIRAEDLLKLAKSQLNIGECFVQAKLKLAGNEAVAVSFGRALFA